MDGRQYKYHADYIHFIAIQLTVQLILEQNKWLSIYSPTLLIITNQAPAWTVWGTYLLAVYRHITYLSIHQADIPFIRVAKTRHLSSTCILPHILPQFFFFLLGDQPSPYYIFFHRIESNFYVFFIVTYTCSLVLTIDYTSQVAMAQVSICPYSHFLFLHSPSFLISHP